MSELTMKNSFAGELRSVWTHRTLGACVAATVFALSCLLLSSYPPTYSAESLIIMDTPRRVIADQAPVIDPKPVDTILIQTGQAVITSGDFLERVVVRLGLHEEPRFLNTGKGRLFLTAVEDAGNRVLGWGEGLAQAMGTPFRAGRLVLARPADRLDQSLPTGPERVSAAVEVLRRAVAVTQVGRSTVLSIRADAFSPDLAARIANSLAEQYEADSAEEQVAAARSAASTIKSRLDELQADLARSQRAVADFKADAAMDELLSPVGSVVPAILKAISDANGHLMAVQAERLALEARIANLDSRHDGGTTTNILASPIVQKLREQEALLVRQQAEIQGRLGDQHPTARDISRQIAETRRSIRMEIAAIAESLRNELKVASEKERLMGANLDLLNRRLQNYQRMQPALAQLEQEVASNRRMYDTFLERFKQTEEQQRLVQPNARVVSAAKMPARPSHPRIPLVLAGSLLGGAAAGVLAAFGRSRLRTTFLSADEVAGFLGRTDVAIVPELKSTHRYELTAGADLTIMTGNLAAFSEAMSNVKFLASRKPEDVVVLFTSAVPGEGKTFMAVSAALNAAGSGTRTLYVDCDIYKDHNNAIHAPILRGLTDCLVGSMSWRDAVTSGGDGLPDFLLRGGGQADPARLLSSRTLRRIIEEARHEYDLVILDGPPVLATGSSRFLAAWADSVVFIVRWAATPRSIVRAAHAELAGAGASLSGCVLNRADLRRLRRFGQNGSGAHYGAYRNYTNAATALGSAPSGGSVSIDKKATP